MPLPFLKLKQDAAASSPVEVMERKPDEQDEKEYDGLEAAMEELHQALTAKNYAGAAQIFRDAAELVDSQPHEEGEHTNEGQE
jgi:hypothetical protein